MTKVAETIVLLRRVMEGESLVINSDEHTLHDLTQLAVALQPHANLAIRYGQTMTPLERATIASAGRGRVVFL